MLFIVYAISLQSLAPFCSAFVDLPLKIWQDGSKPAFVQVPYIHTIRNTQIPHLQKDINQLWPKGVVRYFLDNQSYDSFINSSLQASMTLIESESCIKFHEQPLKPTDNKTWIHFTNPHKERACVHELKFMQNGEIVVTLGYDCLTYRDILHTLLHGIGFKDEVTHPHRDNYIKVLWNNIHPGYRSLFIKESTDSARISIEYDPLSVMHFHERAYSINGKATIVPSEPGLVIHPSDSLSQLDRMRLHMYFGYECNRRNINHLLDSCKMTLQKKDDREIKDDDDKDHKLEQEKDVDEKLKGKDNNDEGSDFGDDKQTLYANINKTKNDDDNDNLGEDKDVYEENVTQMQNNNEGDDFKEERDADIEIINKKQNNDESDDLAEYEDGDDGENVNEKQNNNMDDRLENKQEIHDENSNDKSNATNESGNDKALENYNEIGNITKLISLDEYSASY